MFAERLYCGKLTRSDVDKEILLAGWVDRRRDHGGIIFIMLRDVSGIVQIVADESLNRETALIADKLRNEFCICVKGTVRLRGSESVNPDMKTGEIEIVASSIEILSESEVPPFQIETRDHIHEDIRLKYRYLDLRRENMQISLIKRHEMMQTTRNYLVKNNFIEIETPVLNKSTPEGARDFLVPSRLHGGQFYALPQSPQLFKQILMISGFDRYFNIVKCFRDEDLRNDRQPEFTQIDMELSFIDQQMIMKIIEGLLKDIVKTVTGKEIGSDFPVLSYEDAMERYGKDAPDTRFGLELLTVTDIFKDSEFKVFKNTIDTGGVIKVLPVESGDKITRKMLDDYTEWVKIFKAGGLPNCRFRGGNFEGGISKFLSEDEKKKLIEKCTLKDDTVLFFGCDRKQVVNDSLGNLRIKIAKDIDIIDQEKLNFVWVTQFPLLEYSYEDKRYFAKHHPFTAPAAESMDKLNNITPENVDDILAQAYDIVLNGVEIGGGSIRINRPEIQSRMFDLIGINEEEANEKFSFLLDALKFGAPPHGGLALGLDRIMMILLQRESIREVIAFPKTQRGQCMMSQAPSAVAKDQLKELSLRISEIKND
ncbi:MAG: aspartate--tRNA ligase [Spirochaetes bacterium]|nr:aspartate--tRNA ligase [Spirochaetota bacterium]